MAAFSREFAIIAGSGFQSLAAGIAGEVQTTEYGPTSSPIRQIIIADRPLQLLSRHGDNSHIAPHAINYRANLKALKLLGITDIIALNTVGIIAADLLAGQLIVPDQIIDYTYGRDHSIYGADSASLEHIDFTQPFHEGLRQELLAAANGVAVPCDDGGVYAVTQGPRLETAAEIDRLEQDGADIVGMTAMPEAALARELGINYACVSLLVNYAAGRGDGSIHEDIKEHTAMARANCLTLLGAFF